MGSRLRTVLASTAGGERGRSRPVAGRHPPRTRRSPRWATAGVWDDDDDLPQFQAQRARQLVRRGDIAAGRAELSRVVLLPALPPELIGVLHRYLADAARRAGDLDEARAALARARAQAHPGPGVFQRQALHCAAESAIAQAAGDHATAAVLLAAAVTHAVESKDGPVTGGSRRAGHHPRARGARPAPGQRGACDLCDPEVRATLDEVRALPGSAGALDRARALSRTDGIALLHDYV